MRKPRAGQSSDEAAVNLSGHAETDEDIARSDVGFISTLPSSRLARNWSSLTGKKARYIHA